MKYHLQNKTTGEWITGLNDDWTPIWGKTRDQAKLFDRCDLQILKGRGQLISEWSAFKGEWSDVRAPDGVVSFARRLVRKNGVVSFGGYKFRHDKLLPFVGQRIFVEAEDYWFTNPRAFKTKEGLIGGPENHICDLDMMEDRLRSIHEDKQGEGGYDREWARG